MTQDPLLPSSGVPSREISLSLREHNVSFVLPAGAKMEGNLVTPGGVMIYGELVGDVFCESGSFIVMPGAAYRGIAEADCVYVSGTVASSAGRKRSALVSRNLLAASKDAQIDADLFAQSFALHKARVWGQLHALDEAAHHREGNQAVHLASRSQGASDARTARDVAPDQSGANAIARGKVSPLRR
jgi:hypothetical protein